MQSTASISINSQIHSRIYWSLLLSLKIKSLLVWYWYLLSSLLSSRSSFSLKLWRSLTKYSILWRLWALSPSSMYGALLFYSTSSLMYSQFSPPIPLCCYRWPQSSIRFPSSQGLEIFLMAGTQARASWPLFTCRGPPEPWLRPGPHHQAWPGSVTFQLTADHVMTQWHAQSVKSLSSAPGLRSSTPPSVSSHLASICNFTYFTLKINCC